MIAKGILAFVSLTIGVTFLRLAWRLATIRVDASYRRQYPTWRHALFGRRLIGGRSHWLVYNRRANRLEAGR
jgi:hypothetical protein